jgi:hypothetical protein
MALTVTPLHKWTLHNTGGFMVLILVTGDASYPNTGGTIGYPITPATFFLNSFVATDDFSPNVPNPAYFNLGGVAPAGAAGGFVKMDGTTNNLRFFGPTGTEIANTATAAGISSVLMAFGN